MNFALYVLMIGDSAAVMSKLHDFYDSKTATSTIRKMADLVSVWYNILSERMPRR